jgi:spore maturation protein CgeB
MKIIVFGLSISSAWGNGHATLWRGLFRALAEQGHQIHFFEKDVPYYASHRDAVEFPFARLILYQDFNQVIPVAEELLRNADAAIISSYCPDGARACDIVLGSNVPRKVFYDMDTPVTLLRLEHGENVAYVPSYGLGDFDLVLSYTGGEALTLLRQRLGAEKVATLYGWVDPEVYRPTDVVESYRSDLSYLGTYSADRQLALEELFLRPAATLREMKFVVGGAMHPNPQAWPSNVRYFDHVPPSEHCGFYSSAPLTLSVTRGAMAAMGYCPSGRLFEAAACGTAVLSDWWTGLDEFFRPGEEILIAHSSADVAQVLREGPGLIRRVAERARVRTMECHTAELRARRLLDLLAGASMDAPELVVQGGA